MLVLLAMACSASATQVVTPTPTLIPTSTVSLAPTPTTFAEPMVTIGDIPFTVELADTPEKRTQGLSGRASLGSGAGMLFVFDSDGRFIFWMPEMHFPLDFVWITADCSVGDITEDVPAPPPDMSLSDLPRYQPEVPVRYVLEINAGAIAAGGIAKGDPVSFGGILAGKYGC